MTLIDPSPEGSSARDPLLSIQYLRGLAALMVVFHHAFTGSLTNDYADTGLMGAAGVDVFFVISGFIIWTTAGRTVQPVLDFIKRRALRVYPVYWVTLSAWILLRLVVPDRLHNADVTAVTVPLSFLLVPHQHAVFNNFWPILVPGWTLQFEVFFYAVFATCLLLPAGPARGRAVFLAIGGLVALGFLFRPGGAILSTYTNPLLLEFLAGVTLALLRPQLRWLGLSGGLVLLAGGIGLLAALHPSFEPQRWNRVLDWGIPAVLVVAGGLALETVLARRPSWILLRLGDASYSLYLSHVFSLIAVTILWKAARLPVGNAAALWGLIGTQVVAAILGALAFYQCVELPVLRRLKRQRPPRLRPGSSVPHRVA